MQLSTPFITPVACFDFSEHLPFLRSLYATEKDGFLPCLTGGMSTTLPGYELANENNRLIATPDAESLRKAVEGAALEFAAALGYASDKYTPHVRNFWLNEMQSGNFHETHSHYGNHFSGCLYVDVPPGSAQIRFHSPKERFDHSHLAIAQYTVFNSLTWMFHPVEGQLYLWESWIKHGVPAGDFEGVRRSAALDVVMNPK